MEPIYVRTLDELGRIVLPSELRQELGWCDGDAIEIYNDGNKMILQLQEKCNE